MADYGRKTYGLWKDVLPEDSSELAKLRIHFSERTEEEIEEIASENSDSIYSSTPEVKAWASGECHRQYTTYGLKQAEKSVSLQSYSLLTATWAVNNEEYELAPVLELTYLVIPMSENTRVSAKGRWGYALIMWWSVVFLMSMCKPTSNFSYYN